MNKNNKISENGIIFNEFFFSRKDDKRDIVNSIYGFINQNKIDTSLTGDEFELLIDEAVTNAMEHGNKWDPEKKVYVKINKNSEYVFLKIKDEGDGFSSDGKFCCKGTLKERGMGMPIIDQYSDHRWSYRQNVLEVKLKIS